MKTILILKYSLCHENELNFERFPKSINRVSFWNIPNVVKMSLLLEYSFCRENEFSLRRSNEFNFETFPMSCQRFSSQIWKISLFLNFKFWKKRKLIHFEIIFEICIYLERFPVSWKRAYFWNIPYVMKTSLILKYSISDEHESELQ